MKNIQELIQSLTVKELSNGEILYSFYQFYQRLKEIDTANIYIQECVITPYYVHDGKRLELYQFELNICHNDFEKYLLEKTGKTKLDDIPKEIIFLQMSCYIGLSDITQEISPQKILKYIDYLFHNDSLKQQIQRTFNEFDINKLFFEVY